MKKYNVHYYDETQIKRYRVMVVETDDIKKWIKDFENEYSPSKSVMEYEEVEE